MADPQTREDWQKAATSAVILLALEDAEAFDLVPVNPLNVDVARAQEIIDGAFAIGIHPQIAHVKTFTTTTT